MIRALAVLLICLTTPVTAQEMVITSPIDGSTTVIPDVEAEAVRALSGAGAALKGLDRLSGQVSDINLRVGETALFGRIEVSLGECRYPEDNPAGEAYAWLSMRDQGSETALFEGWMIASSPALNALDHARYDVWVIRCTTA